MCLCRIPCPLQQGYLTSLKDIELCCVSLKLGLGNVVFLCGGQMMDVYWVKHTFIGWFAACWGLQRGACELGSAGESTAGCWGGTGERDCLATVGSPNVSLTKKAWMSYDEGSTHTSPPFNLLYMHTNTHTVHTRTSTQVGNLHVYQFINTYT